MMSASPGKNARDGTNVGGAGCEAQPASIQLSNSNSRSLRRMVHSRLDIGDGHGLALVERSGGEFHIVFLRVEIDPGQVAVRFIHHHLPRRGQVWREMDF